MKRSLALLPLLLASCGKEPPPPSQAPSAAASAPLAPMTASVSAAPSAQAPSASATPETPETKDGRYAKNLAMAELSIADWKCSANKPAKLAPHMAAIITFRCPENTQIKELDVLANQGFALIGAGELVLKGVQQMEVIKTPNGGMLHKVRDGKAQGMLIHYSYWPLIPIPTGYRAGMQQEVTHLFELIDDKWEEASNAPHEPARGRLAGPKGPFVFPFDPLKLGVKVCRAEGGKCAPDASGATSAFAPLEIFEMWSGDSYVTDALDLAGPYRTKLTLAKALLFAFAPKDPSQAPSAAPSPTPSAAPAAPPPSGAPPAPPAPSAMVSATSGVAAKHPYEAEDVEGCPLGLYRAAVESFVLSRLLNDASDKVAEAADKVMAKFPMDLCAAHVTGLPAWSTLRDKLVNLSDRPLSRQVSQPSAP